MDCQPLLLLTYLNLSFVGITLPTTSFLVDILKTKGLIVDTFDLLEASVIKALTHGACAPNDTTPPIFCIGPLITSAKDNCRPTASNCMAWLDAQPNASVVFLCFGSRGVLSEAQIREIAIGLERSNNRFLWVIKNPQGSESDPNLEELLPQGFLERTKEKGLFLVINQ
ncbi:hypothetical protein L6164_015020 [Bauhinia variegata]|uniref:Uncharacterized protein n=1 Tax=Bauhinia variegata TaxID=167791 RepID=A0ACB9NKC4_BAUVA|nr:hypothetical protein L6164_015020 [Bauhinia variegata]